MRRRLLIGALLLSVLAPLRGQTPPARLIHVDVHATDRGVAVEDLTAADFELQEDGTTQAITGFDHIKAGPGSLRQRLYIVFVDTNHSQVESSSELRLPLVRFLDRLLGPEDLVGVLTPEMSAADL